MVFERELLVATEAVRKASFLTKRIQSKVIEQRNSSTLIKDDKSPVTIGDYAAQTVIINAIKANFPEDKVLGEESASDLTDDFLQQILDEIKTCDGNFDPEYGKGFHFTSSDFPLKSIDDVRTVINHGDYKGGRSGRFWCLDPIDGTKGFLRGEQFAVCLGLIEKGITQVGVIGCPNLSLAQFGSQDLPEYEEFGYTFRAIRGHGAFLSTNTDCQHWERIHSRTLKDTAEFVSLEGVEKSHSAHDDQSIIKSTLGIQKSAHLDSQVKYCLLAMGLGDVYLRLPINMSYQEKIYDHAAGNVLIHEAGGFHTDAVENVPLDFGHGLYLQTKGVIASCGPKNLHNKILKTSKEVLNSRSAQ